MASGTAWTAGNAKFTANLSGSNTSLGAGMIGSDGAASVDLGAGRVAWLMGDFPCATAAGQTRHTATWCRNGLLLQTGTTAPYDLSDAGTILTTYTGGTVSAPTDFFPMDNKDGAPHWFWPNNGLMVDGNLVLLAYRMEATFRTAGHSLYVIDNPSATPANWNIPRFDTLIHSDPRFIIAGPVIDDGDSWVYLSAFQQGGALYMCRVARTELVAGRITQPQWWRVNSAWSYDDPEVVGALYGYMKRAAVEGNSLSPHQTIHKRGAGDYVQVCHKGNPVNLAYDAASTLSGPFTPVNFYQPPESTQSGYSVYSGKAHPEQTWSGKGANDCLVTYATNTSAYLDDYGSYWPRCVQATGLI
jgi:hypothetical protein